MEKFREEEGGRGEKGRMLCMLCSSVQARSSELREGAVDVFDLLKFPSWKPNENHVLYHFNL